MKSLQERNKDSDREKREEEPTLERALWEGDFQTEPEREESK